MNLWTPPSFAVLRHRRREKLVTLPTGERVKVTVDDSGTVTQIEHDDTLDGIVTPKPIRLELRPRSVSMASGRHLNRIASGFRLKKVNR